ncbi:phosphopyruvate hydratase [Mucilaginibacter rubeus]|uniref:Enolase n=1 Tax=Mucilaginibacter rubeus TaxID=2027860 RepID=A0AAE6JJ53_9SPHI|nr:MULTISPECIES: phosphopyruvate hydratase [Mucilaginibacter]QEM06611.1 phosphopyruvate hydratase [Mucilaginibacter rubeus]QEM19200.1 phosphopyruvate hydratase [Mucilaginibacter gossypii]QTE44256.1 phosphopyruvate hydratase [Mucilaginibacter rubeus]QTE50856.1 phosphopyruvate hydratase [Mucilaginibacter rubeus]QTE55938.1 phosphopyruvate hydratase [Mucilaginibacter rubeus]
MKITAIKAREVLDSRGNPTVEAEIQLADGSTARGISPSGASTGEKEAVELRDGDKSRYQGKGVEIAVSGLNKEVNGAISGREFDSQEAFDKQLIELDGTANKSRLGANAMLAASIAYARVSSVSKKIPLYRQLVQRDKYLMPVPCMNVINGGRHADNNVDFQEFMIAPHNAPSFKESIRMGEEVFHTLKSLLSGKGYSTGVGDEGGFAPNLKSNEEAVEVIMEAITKAGYKPGEDISICLDPATSEMWKDGKYSLFKSTKQNYTSDQLIDLWEEWINKYPIVLLEDGLGENDWEGWKRMTDRLGSKAELVGDDIFCTNPEIIQRGIDAGIGNSVLIKLNQIGTIWETLQAVELAQKNNYHCFISHRSGETEDTTIADLVVATNAGHIKTGSGCRSERISKFNQLLRIEEELGANSVFAGKSTFKGFL